MTASAFVDLRPAVAKRRNAIEFAGYFACSLAALIADFTVFNVGLRLGADYAAAAAIGFVVGLAIAYTLSVRFVFGVRRLTNERLEFMIFAGVGIGGLLLTEMLLWLLIRKVGLSAMAAKLASASVVFVFNFTARKALLFTRRQLGTSST